MDSGRPAAGPAEKGRRIIAATLALAGFLSILCRPPGVNAPPLLPDAPEGPATCYLDSACQFAVSPMDPDSDSVAVRFDWGDGDTSGWSEWQANGSVFVLVHAWDNRGAFAVRAQARDRARDESEWSPASSVAVVPGYPDSVVAVIPVGQHPSAIRASPDGRYVYVVSSDEGANGWLSVISTESDSVVTSVHGVSGNDVVPMADGHRAVVCGCRLTVLRLPGCIAETSFTLGWEVGKAAYVPGRSLLYATTWSLEGHVEVYDTDSFGEVATLDVDGVPLGAAVHPSGDYVYVSTSDGDRLYRINTKMHVAVDSVDMGSGPISLAVTPDGTRLLVVNSEDGWVHVLDPGDLGRVNQVWVGGDPSAVAVAPDGRYAYVSREGELCVVRLSDVEVVARVPVSCQWADVAVLPDGDKVYLADWDSGTVTVLRRP